MSHTQNITVVAKKVAVFLDTVYNSQHWWTLRCLTAFYSSICDSILQESISAGDHGY